MYIVQHYNYYIFHRPAYINKDANGTPYFVRLKLNLINITVVVD